jgi:hypothetical protein
MIPVILRAGIAIGSVWTLIPDKHKERIVDAAFDVIYSATGKASEKVEEYFDSDSQQSFDFDDSEEHF